MVFNGEEKNESGEKCLTEAKIDCECLALFLY